MVWPIHVSRRGEIKGFTGIDAVYEEPEAPDIVVGSRGESVEESVDMVLAALEARGIIPPTKKYGVPRVCCSLDRACAVPTVLLVGCHRVTAVRPPTFTEGWRLALDVIECQHVTPTYSLAVPPTHTLPLFLSLCAVSRSLSLSHTRTQPVSLSRTHTLSARGLSMPRRCLAGPPRRARVRPSGSW